MDNAASSLGTPLEAARDASAGIVSPLPTTLRRLSSVRVQAYFFLFGVATLLPWNCLLSVMAFMDIVSFKGRGWTLLCSPLYNTGSLTTQLFMLFAGQFLTTWKIISVSLPFGAACCLVLVLSLSTTLPETVRFPLGLVSVVCSGCSVAGLLQSSIGELCGKLTAQYGPVAAHNSNGLAAAGVLSLVLADLLAVVGSQALAARSLFVITAVVLLGCLGALVDLVRSGTLFPSSDVQCSSPTPPSNYDLRIIVGVDDLKPPGCNAPEEMVKANPVPIGAEIISCSMNPTSLSSDASAQGSSSQLSRRESLQRVYGSVARGWRQEVNLMVIFFQTFVVFPAVCLKWTPQHGWMQQESYGLVMVSIFQLLDLFGRLLCTLPIVIRSCGTGSKLWIFVFLRTLLLPLFFVGWRQPDSFFGTFIVQAILVALLAFSNGGLCNLAFTLGCSGAAAIDVDIVGRALPLSLNTGIVLGSVASAVSISLL